MTKRYFTFLLSLSCAQDANMPFPGKKFADSVLTHCTLVCVKNTLMLQSSFDLMSSSRMETSGAESTLRCRQNASLVVVNNYCNRACKARVKSGVKLATRSFLEPDMNRDMRATTSGEIA